MSIQLTAADSRALTKLLEKKEKIERDIEKIMGGGVKRKTAKAAKVANKPKTAKEKAAAKNRSEAQRVRREREAKLKAKA